MTAGSGVLGMDANCTEMRLTSLHVNATGGYSVPLYGLDECGFPTYKFYLLHVSALVCIQASILCGAIVIVASFVSAVATGGRRHRNFFRWSTTERLVVYLAVCDLLFNISHTIDHAYIVATQDHVPQPECAIFGFMLAEFITAQNLMVNVIAFNCFILIVFGKKLRFGPYDMWLLLWTFGAPFLGSVINVSLGYLGPNGVFCYFDVKLGALAGIFYTTVPLLLVLLLNTLLYIGTWKNIRNQALQIKGSETQQAVALRRVHDSARTMMLFVAAFFVQWWAMAVFGIWELIETPDYAIFFFVVTFSNIGGVLNGGIYFIIRRRKHQRHVRKQKQRQLAGKDTRDPMTATASTPDMNRLRVYADENRQETSLFTESEFTRSRM